MRLRGFSLLELLVAIALLGVLAVLLWRGLGGVIAQRERIDRDAAHVERVIRLLAQLERDLAQCAPDMVIRRSRQRWMPPWRFGQRGAQP
jgi:general secretion pathway protein J